MPTDEEYKADTEFSLNFALGKSRNKAADTLETNDSMAGDMSTDNLSKNLHVETKFKQQQKNKKVKIKNKPSVIPEAPEIPEIER